MKTNKKLLILFFTISISFLHSETLKLDITTTITKALENNITLKNQGVSLLKAVRQSDSSNNYYYPSINGSISLRDGLSIYSSSISNSLSVSPSLSVGYTLQPNLKETIKSLELAVNSGELSYDSAKLQLLNNVERQFYSLLSTQGSLSNAENNIKLAQKAYDQTKVKFDNGLASEMDLLRAEVSASNLVPTYRQNLITYQNNFKEFLLLLGIDPSTEVELIGSLDIQYYNFDSNDLIERFILNRPDIKSQMLAITTQENSLKSNKKSTYIPSVNFSSSISKSFNIFGGSTIPGASILSPSFSLSMSYSFDTFFKNSRAVNNLKGFEDDLVISRRNLENTVSEAKLEISNLVNTLEVNKESIDSTTLNLELSQKSYNMTLENFNRGLSNQTALDDSQQQLMTAEQNLIASKYTYLSNLINLRAALGVSSLNEILE